MKYFANIFYILCLLQLGVGAVSGQVGEQLHLVTIEQKGAEYDSSVVDTVYSDFPHIKRVYNWGSDKVGTPSVPFVELDTNTYEKKLWLSEKKLLSLPIKSQLARLVAMDSVVYVAYSVRDATWYLYSTFSTNYGGSWTPPYFIQETGQTAGDECLLIDDQQVFLAYSAKFEDAYEWEMLFRKTDTGFSILGDSIVVDTTFFSSEAVYGPGLVSWGDTLFVSYFNYHDATNFLKLKKSYDQGESWVMVSGDAVTASGVPHFFLLTDTVLSEVCRSGLDVRIYRSFDGGLTWPVDTFLSAVDGYASQAPSASTDGVSDIHVVWADHDSAPRGWGGYAFYRRTLDNGQNWEAIKSLSTEGYAEWSDIWTDTAYVYAVWSDGRFGSPNYALYLRYSHDRGQSWSSEIMIVDSLDPARQPDVYAWEDYFYLTWEEQHPPEWIWGVYFIFGAWYLPGDVDYLGEVNVADLTYLVDYLFRGGEEPFVPDAAQMDGEDGINIADLTYLVDYLFRGGPPPVGGSTGL